MVYQIMLRGQVDPGWSDFFGGMEISLEPGKEPGCVTILTGEIADQAALRGLVNRLWDLNLTILSLNQIDRSARSG